MQVRVRGEGPKLTAFGATTHMRLGHVSSIRGVLAEARLEQLDYHSSPEVELCRP